MGFVRTIQYYANIPSYLTTHPINRLYGKLTTPFREKAYIHGLGNNLFPGIIPIILTLIGLIFSFRNAFKVETVGIYLAILILAFLFTFGPHGPYILLYKYVPGFDGIRVASRFHIFVMFSLAVLSAFGVRTPWIRFIGTKKYAIVILSCLFILIEYLSIPIPLASVRVKENIPEVYKWLAKQEGDFAIIEYPLRRWIRVSGITITSEFLKVYYSTYHWKRLVNGWSSYLSPTYEALRRRHEEFPSKSTIKDLKSIGVRFIISHSSPYKKDTDGLLKFIGNFGGTYVYEIKGWKEGKKAFEAWKKGRQSSSVKNSYTLPKTGWEVESNYHPELAGKVIDGDYSTRWHSGRPQRPGIYFQVDLKGIYAVSGLVLHLGNNFTDYPRGYKVEVSLDKKRWVLVAKNKKYRLPLRSFLEPLKLRVDIPFNKKVPARYIKVTQTGFFRFHPWSIYEIDVKSTKIRWVLHH